MSIVCILFLGSEQLPVGVCRVAIQLLLLVLYMILRKAGYPLYLYSEWYILGRQGLYGFYQWLRIKISIQS